MTEKGKAKKPNSRRNLDLAIQREFPSAEDPTRPRTALADAVLTQLYDELREGRADVLGGRTRPAEDVVADLRAGLAR